ncbi:hypothetical protein OBBRIDRAFT_799449 [Obba rivulosa]|uniref:Uncharacterized protein n=1 Tax=Obba rivulosa TaxID=1052685 RepID=A0A8E2DES5_9APHY|nr:hypothetical protein OBBRIDRAFT_799449 [Obba rivulosa]
MKSRKHFGASLTNLLFCDYSLIGRHALSKRKQRQISSQHQEQWMKQASKDSEEPKKGLRTICQNTKNECFRKTGKLVKLSKTTLAHRWLTEEETEAVLTFATELANRSFPLSHARIKEHVNEICCAQYGTEFWSSRGYWSYGLNTTRARAVNTHTHDTFYDLLEEAIEGEDNKEPIEADCTYGADETSMQKGIGVTKRVFGEPGKGVQHQQCSGGRENITVIVTICADGTYFAPMVIFKGKGYQTNWKQLNPLNAS